MKKHVPNLFTFGNLFCGFLSIPYIIHDDLRNATILIFIAIMLDAVDGRIARILGVSNAIGKELDSLADIVSFGVAPSFLAAQTYFYDLGMTGIIMSGLFPLFGAYRLARFNITSTEDSLKHFKGIPITLAGGIVTFLTLFVGSIPLWVFILLFYGLCFFMVSRVKIPSLKKLGVPLPKYSVLITLFLFYMFYLVSKSRFENVPAFFYVALCIYLLFIILRYFKEKEPKFAIRRRNFRLPKRLFKKKNKKH
ncbi:CDP-diacylglycerol--serine O-phosphatidyltransferase [Peribacillus saganii]|uniref:CDP-diacylglycerol--serine O-phosphatidyltransferase n=2 Tax=Peribacillus saganii TaxID=2303992 RepID=A0A372LLH7_9BACI|nr:CDP-diacylglycerol--serine O-phosphatidyltransferase [Peribacillus saganii]